MAADRLPSPSPGLLPLLRRGVDQVGPLAAPAVVLDAATRCEDVEDHFRARPELTSVVVVDPARPGEIGQISRTAFLHTMSGLYGRSLHGRSAVAGLARWDPELLPADAPVQRAAILVLGRAPESRYDDLIVECADGTWAILTAAAVLESLSHALAEQVLVDGLTGLANRERLTGALLECSRRPGPGQPVALLFIDLDRFKRVNDEHGHHVGDALLTAVAGRLRAAARPDDLVARLGGDEFAVLVSVTAPQSAPGSAATALDVATAVADRILEAVTRPYDVDGMTLTVGASIGLSVHSGAGLDPEQLLRAADDAMYLAKDGGGDRVQVAATGPRRGRRGRRGAPAAPAAGRAGTAARTHHRGAVDLDQLVVLYEPICDLVTGMAVGVEAGARWRAAHVGAAAERAPGPGAPGGRVAEVAPVRDAGPVEDAGPVPAAPFPDAGPVPADPFPDAGPFPVPDAGPVPADPFPDADHWVLQEACTGLAGEPAAALATVKVRLSPRQLGHPELASRVLTVVERSGLGADRLRLRLPAVDGEALAAAEPALSALRAAGVQLVLPAGSTTLRALSSVAVDGLELDAFLVGGQPGSARSSAVARLVVELARSLGLDVVGTGVDTVAQLAALGDLGCRYGQGNLLGAPGPLGGLVPSPAPARH